MKTIKEALLAKETSLAVIGLGYVGMPIAVSFARKIKVIGFDVNKAKVEAYQAGQDPTQEVGDEIIAKTSMVFTSNPDDLKEASFYIVAVPTPIYADKTPDLGYLKSACQVVAPYVKKGDYVVFESTVYPGVTRDICLPLLEEGSGLTRQDFHIGYSPERINPGDKTHRLENITKIVSGFDQAACKAISEVYQLVVEAGVYEAESIEVAEAAKVIENAQRDINIAFVNELSIIFDRLHIDTQAVLKAASTKWNFLPFKPGLVGGHCIGIDPYYLTYRANQVGYQPEVILAGRRLNDSMGTYVISQLVDALIQADLKVKHSRILLLGLTFKENTPDLRNSRVADMVDRMRYYGMEILAYDPVCDAKEAKSIFDLEMVDLSQLDPVDAVVVAVNHSAFEALDLDVLSTYYHKGQAKILLDVKAHYDKKEADQKGFVYWRL